MKLYRFRAGEEALDALQAGNFRGVTLANNHIMDFGAVGALETRSRLTGRGIAATGVGLNAAEAVSPAIFPVGGVTVGMVGLTDTMPEWAATHDSPGVAQMTIRNDVASYTMLHRLRQEMVTAGADITILSVHWGPNLVWWPVRRFRMFGRMVSDLGFDVVHGHSAHLLQSVEQRAGRLILYDTGDFIDDYTVLPGLRSDRTAFYRLQIEGGRLSRLTIHPVVNRDETVRLAEPQEAARIAGDLIAKSAARGTRLERNGDVLELNFSGARPTS